MTRLEDISMAMFWEFFTFEMRFRIKSVSTYVYFLVWLAFSFLSVASESFGPVGNSNGKVLLNGPYANSYNDFGACLFGVIIIAAIFGTSILRDFQRDTYQILFTKPVSKFAYLGGRWAGSFVTTVFAFSGMLFGTYFGTLRALGRSRPHRAQPPLVVSPAVPLRSSWSRSFSWARCSSRSRPSPARSSSSICRASRCSCSTSSG